MNPIARKLQSKWEKIARIFSRNFNVRVELSGTACHNDMNGTIRIPANADHMADADQAVLEGLLDHEWGHELMERLASGEDLGSELSDVFRLFLGGTLPSTLMKRAKDKVERLMLNVFEDIRLELILATYWPGVRDNLYTAHAHSTARHVKDGVKAADFWWLIGVGIIYRARGQEHAFLPAYIVEILDAFLVDIPEEARHARTADDSSRLAKEVARRLKKHKEEMDKAIEDLKERIKDKLKSGELKLDDSDGEDGAGGEDGPPLDIEFDEDEIEDLPDDVKDKLKSKPVPVPEDEAEEDAEPGAGPEDETDEDAASDDGTDASADSDKGDTSDGEALEEGDGTDEESEGATPDLKSGKSDDTESGTRPELGSDDTHVEDSELSVDDMKAELDEMEADRDDLEESLDSEPEVIDTYEDAHDDIEEKAETDFHENDRWIPDPETVARDKWHKPRANARDDDEYLELKAIVRQQISALRAKLLTMLRIQTQHRVIADRERGDLDGASLYSLRLGNTRVFSHKIKGLDIDTAVSLLIDESGSMGNGRNEGSKAYYAKLTAIAMAETLDAISIPFEVIGFNNIARGYHGDTSYSRWLPLWFNVFKAFDEKLRRTRGRFSHIDGHHENTDGEAVWHVARRLAARPEGRKILIVLSDGLPSGGGRGLAGHLLEVVKKITDAGIEVYGFGMLTTSVARFYNQDTGAEHIVIKDMDTLAKQVFKLLKKNLPRRAA